MYEQLAQVISNYQPPQETVDYVSNHSSLNIAGPTGAGKGTLVLYLTQTGKYAPVVSDTTRQPRPHNDGFEVNGVVYWFISEVEALEKLQQQQYIEAKLVHGTTVYGTSTRSYQRVIDSGKTPVLEIDVQGMEDLMERFPEFETIFLLPPDFDTWQTRLDGRGRMQLEEKISRLKSACTEIETLINNPRFYPVINTEVVDTAELITSGEYKTEEYRQSSLETAKLILEKTKQFLASV